jgi:hypothetical protein
MAQTPCIRVAEGFSLDRTFTADAKAGEVVLVGTKPLIVSHAVDKDTQPVGAVDSRGLFDIPQKAETIDAGDAVYWDPTGDPVVGDAGSGAATETPTAYPLGRAAPMQPNGGVVTVATDKYVRVLVENFAVATTVAGSVTADDITGSDASLDILGRTGPAATNNGGAVALTGGTGNTTGNGGAASVTGGVAGATSGTGGAATLAGGATAGLAGDNYTGGAANVTGGTGKGTGAGGAVAITSGKAGITGAGGAITIVAGQGGNTSGAAGTVAITGAAGNGTTNGAGGAVSSTGGAGKGNLAGGAASVVGGAGGATGAGGAVAITGGAGGATSGTGGAVTITSGAGTNGDANSGAVAIDAGAPDGSGVGGAITIGGTNASSITLGKMPRIPTATVEATGTDQGTAAAVAEGFTLVTAANATKAVKLPPAIAGAQVIIKNAEAAVLKIFPNTDDAINALAANTGSLDIAASTSVLLVAYNATTWYSVPLLPS